MERQEFKGPRDANGLDVGWHDTVDAVVPPPVRWRWGLQTVKLL
jgi:hypothetical protein